MTDELLVTIRWQSPLRRMWREWLFALKRVLGHVQFNPHRTPSANDSGIYSSRSSRRASDEIELTIYQWARGSKIRQLEAKQLFQLIEQHAEELGYVNVASRYHASNING